jgi:hypothetical protein
MASLAWQTSDLVKFLVTWVVTALFIHFAARIVLDKSSFTTALVVALLGSLLFLLVLHFVAGKLGFVLAIAAWALVCAIFYRSGLLKAAVVGLVAWVLAVVVSWIVGQLLR